MVRGLDIFRTHFADHADQYVLIGGTAATLAMEGAGLEFRATKDLDIVLHIEALRPEFGTVFWSFVEAGGYEVRQASVSGTPVFYIRKHANDVLRLSQLLAPELRIAVAPRIANDLNRFLDGIKADRSIDPRSIGINSNVSEIGERIALVYDLTLRHET
ncbi:MAG: hypothetical protein Q8M11_21025 [Sulfuritalea sp.]|nr:hypothetical protein [Sulfuritalea sp.]MDP1982545.1 hypothetical protein [Sulfuritalea sp.]